MVILRAQKLNGFISTFRGLMCMKNIIPVYFETRFGIHTFFVREPIDILILDQNGYVKVVQEGLKPWRIFVWNLKYFRVLEMPHGSIKGKKIKKGEKITIIEQ